MWLEVVLFSLTTERRKFSKRGEQHDNRLATTSVVCFVASSVFWVFYDLVVNDVRKETALSFLYLPEKKMIV